MLQLEVDDLGRTIDRDLASLVMHLPRTDCERWKALLACLVVPQLLEELVPEDRRSKSGHRRLPAQLRRSRLERRDRELGRSVSARLCTV